MARRRTFLAIILGDKVRNQLLSLQQELSASAGEVNWVEPENLHLTLLFLGEVEQREVLDVCRVAQKAVAKMPEFSISVEGAGCFPNPRRPRTLWVGVGEGAAEVCAVHDAIETPLLDRRGYRRETRAYVPHVTLGRVKGDPENEELAKAIVQHQTWNAGDVLVREVHIMTSELTREGPSYTVVGRAKLL